MTKYISDCFLNELNQGHLSFIYLCLIFVHLFSKIYFVNKEVTNNLNLVIKRRIRDFFLILVHFC